MNRAPGPSDFWFKTHQDSCSGTFVKIREPPKKETVRKDNSSSITKATPNTTVAEGMKKLFGGVGHKLVETASDLKTVVSGVKGNKPSPKPAKPSSSVTTISSVKASDAKQVNDNWYWQDYHDFEDYSTPSSIKQKPATDTTLNSNATQTNKPSPKPTKPSSSVTTISSVKASDTKQVNDNWYWQDYHDFEDYSTSSSIKHKPVTDTNLNPNAPQADKVANENEEWFWQDYTEFEEYAMRPNIP